MTTDGGKTGARESITLREFAGDALGLFVPVCIALVVLTGASYGYGRLAGKAAPLLRVFDLRKEGNIATWSEGVLFLVCALAFYCLGWSGRSPLVMRRSGQWLYRFFALAMVFLAADEMLEIHEHVGKILQSRTGLWAGTRIQNIPFSWIFVYGPPALLGVVLLFAVSRGLIRKIEGEGPAKTRAMRALVASGVMIMAVLLFEAAEGYACFLGNRETILPVFEEASELAALWLLSYAHLQIAVGYRL